MQIDPDFDVGMLGWVVTGMGLGIMVAVGIATLVGVIINGKCGGSVPHCLGWS